MDTILARLNSRSQGSRKATLFAIAIADLAAVVVVGLIGLDAIAPFIGGIAGVVLYGTVYCAYATILTADQQDRLNLKNGIPLGRRRTLVFVLAAVWIIALLLSSRVIPDVLNTLVGTLSVFVVCTLVMTYRMSSVEEIDAQITADLPEDGGTRVPALRRQRRRAR
jgi:hypothetical protein